MFYQGKNVLVAGGAGFVGSHFVEELRRRGARVRATTHRRALRSSDAGIEILQTDLASEQQCLAACSGMDIVIQAAGSVGAAAVTPVEVMAGIAGNLILNSRLLQSAWAAGCERFLIFGSSSGYPPANHALREDEMWSGPTYTSAAYFGYGWMRRYLERLGEFVAANSRLKIALVRPSAIYGRWDNFDPRTSHVIPGLVRRAVARENPFEVWGTGDEVRDFIHVTDFVRGCLLALEKHATCDAVNIGYGQSVTIRELVLCVLRAAGHDGAQVVFNRDRPSAIPVRMIDTGKARRLGFEPVVSLEDGLRDTVQWYRSSIRGQPG